MFGSEISYDFNEKYWLNLNVIAATRFKKVMMVEIKRLENCEKKRYEKSTLERQSLSEVKKGRGLAIWKKLCLQIVEQSNVIQPKTEKTLNIPSSTVRNIIQRIRESGDISVHMGYGLWQSGRDLIYSPLVPYVSYI